MSGEAIQICTTVADLADAERIAASLLAKKLAACVQVSGPVESTFRWRGRIETSQEWVCTIKTRRDAYDAVEAAIRQIHSYEEPEILAFQVVAGSTGYIKWVVDSVEVKNQDDG